MRIEQNGVAIFVELAVDLSKNSSEAWTTIAGQFTMKNENGIGFNVREEPVADSVRSGSVQSSADVAIFVLVLVAAIDDVQVGEA
jgi:hypothetical protein